MNVDLEAGSMSNIRRVLPNIAVRGTLILVLILGGSLFRAWADQPPSATDSEAFQKLRNIVNSRHFNFEDMFVKLSGEERFCRSFMRDLKSGRQIRVMEPHYRTNDLDDPALNPWRECGENPNISEGLRYYPATGTRGFRLYKVDADNNSRNGLEDVLYSEWDSKSVTGPAGFHWWDLKKCQSQGGANAQQDDRRGADGKGNLGDSYGLLIEYRGKTWALAMDDLGGVLMQGRDDRWVKPENYYLRLSSLNRQPELPHRTHYACSWRTIHSSFSEKHATQPSR
jgi:hypothetical protein